MAQIGRYEIIREIGRGGMAVVYKAHDPKLDRVVAIKLIQADAFAAKLFGHIRERFEREARALARLDHPNIVRVLDYGEHEGAPYLVMEYLEGATLKDVRKPLRVDTAIQLIRPVAEALAYVHQNGILHRDVKPSNIMILKNNKVMLTDFGIAKWLNDDEEQLALTGTGVGVGTPEYMAPEQGLGGKVDARTDQYSLTVVFYELITGQKPFRGETPLSVLMKQANDPIPDPRAIVPETNESVKKFLDRAMAKNPDDRYPDWGEFLRDLDGLRLQAIAERIDQGDPPVTRTGVLVDPNAESTNAAGTNSSVVLRRSDVEEIRDARNASPDAPTPDGSTANAKMKKSGGAKRWALVLVLFAFILGGVAAAFQYLGIIDLPLLIMTATQTTTLTPIASETALPTLTLTLTPTPTEIPVATATGAARTTEVIVVEEVITATPDMAMTAMRVTADMAMTQVAEAEKRLEAANRSATEEALLRVQTEAAKAEMRLAEINLQSTELAIALTQSLLERTAFVLTQDARELMTPSPQLWVSATMPAAPLPTTASEPTETPSGPKASWVVWASQRGVDAMFGYNVETEEKVELKKNREGKFVLDGRIVLSYKDPVLFMNYPEFLCVGSCTDFEGKSVLTSTNAGTEVVKEYRNSGCKQLTCDKAPCPFDCPYSRSRVLLNSHEIFNAADSRFYNAFWYRTGEKFAILSNFAGKMDIYVYERETKRMVRLLFEQGVQYTSPTWSYDGTKIYFARYDYAGNKNFDIVAIPADGKTHTKKDIEFLLTSPEDEQFPAISPDGHYLAFNRRLGASYEMMVLDLETDEEKRLTDDIVQDILPMWIPD